MASISTPGGLLTFADITPAAICTPRNAAKYRIHDWNTGLMLKSSD